MTVGELIRELQKVSDKSLDVYVNDEHFQRVRLISFVGEDRNLPGVENKVVIFYEE